MIRRSFEFDSFGPWVIEVAGDHKLPPLFLSYKHYIESSLMTIKIPRNIERRNAHPDMHLYDMVIGVFSDHLLFLQRRNNSVIEIKLNVKDLGYITRTECLLKGELNFRTSKGDFTVNYNTVSHEVITKFVDTVRSLLPEAPSAYDFSEIQYSPDDIDILFINLLKSMKNDEPENKLIAYQPNFQVPGPAGFWNKIKGVVASATNFSCSLFMTNSKEFIIIDRSTQILGNKDTTYSYTFTYLPISIIKSIFINNVPDETMYDSFIIQTNLDSLKFYINSSNMNIETICKHFNS